MSTLQAAIDRDRYTEALHEGFYSVAERIEMKYALDGLPPELVSVGLNAAAEGKDAHEAVSLYMLGWEVQP